MLRWQVLFPATPVKLTSLLPQGITPTDRYALQGLAIPNCKLLLTVKFTWETQLLPLWLPPEAVAALVQQLKAQGIEVIICLTVNRGDPLPDPDSLMKLAPMLNAFSYTPSSSGQRYTTPGWIHLVPDDAHNVEPDDVDDIRVKVRYLDQAHDEFSLQHAQALLPTCQVLEVLCLSLGWRFRLDQGLQILTAFRNLRKLGLYFRWFLSPCLQPLNTLGCLQDLALKVQSAECLEDLDDNLCAQLLHFGLVQFGLDHMNCNSLASIYRMTALRTLRMGVRHFSVDNALLLAGMSTPWSVQLCIRGLVSPIGDVLEALSSGPVHIQLLVVHCVMLKDLPRLRPMKDLTCLKFGPHSERRPVWQLQWTMSV